MVVRDKVSIVIPCRNESRYIAGCINSCLLNSYPGHLLEIIVVDGMSDDGTPEIIQKEFGGNKRVKLLENPQRFTPLSLNMGINNSDAEFIMILGAHSTISADYVEKCVGILKTHSDTGGCGGVLRNICEDASTEVISMAMSSPFGVGTAHFRTGYKSGYVDTVAFAIYKREVFDKVGLFDERLTRNQDDEFNFRVTKAGFKMYLESEVTANYFVRSSFSRLYRQYY
jgi:glycosyltransferase involved in cell wall biosynthesis